MRSEDSRRSSSNRSTGSTHELRFCVDGFVWSLPGDSLKPSRQGLGEEGLAHEQSLNLVVREKGDAIPM